MIGEAIFVGIAENRAHDAISDGPRAQ